MQIYKEFNILSAKPTIEEQNTVKHHLIDLISVEQTFSVADFVRLAKNSIEEIKKRGKIPLICGGTGLYLHSLLKNINFEDSETSNNIRQKLWQEYEEHGAERLLLELKKIDIESYNNIHPNNIKRIIRAIEFYNTNKFPISQQIKDSGKIISPYNALEVGLNFEDRTQLYEKINTRAENMLKNGLIDEAKSIFNFKNPGTTAREAIGYKEFLNYFRNIETLSEAIEKFKQNSRNYAKRQITWFKRDQNINWFFLNDYDNNQKELEFRVLSVVNNFIKF